MSGLSAVVADSEQPAAPKAVPQPAGSRAHTRISVSPTFVGGQVAMPPWVPNSGGPPGAAAAARRSSQSGPTVAATLHRAWRRTALGSSTSLAATHGQPRPAATLDAPPSHQHPPRRPPAHQSVLPARRCAATSPSQ